MRKELRLFNIRLFFILLTVLLVFCASFSAACNKNDTVNGSPSSVKLTVADGVGYTAEQSVFEVKRGSSVKIKLEFLPGYVFDGCDYKNYSFENEDERVTVLLLHNLRYPSFVSIRTRATAAGIYYHANGGKFSVGRGDYLLEWANAASGRRQNTNTGALLNRDGYTLIGWNTRADGSGEMVGLGSRITLPRETMLNLYGQWVKWSPSDVFSYRQENDGITLTGYNGGSVQTLTIPAIIDGKTVTRIHSGFANGLQFETVILPYTVMRVEKYAFDKCKVQTLCFSDNLEYIADESFYGAGLTTLRISARIAPRYLGTSEVAEFSDRMDRLILNREKKKMIFFAGCSMCYGLDSQTVYEAFDGEYEIINFGTMGETHAGAQMDCIAKFLSDGDIFIHAPEQAAPYQLMFSDAMEPNIYLLCEGNFDLISYIDISHISGSLTAFNIFNTIRLKIEGGSYLDDTCMHNEFGDITVRRESTGKDVSYNGYEYTYNLTFATQMSISRLCDAYDKIAATGTQVMFSFAPLNYHGLTREAVAQEQWKTFELIYRRGLGSRGYGVISTAENFLLPGRYFYDTDYHLNGEGVVIRTERLVEDIKYAI